MKPGVDSLSDCFIFIDGETCETCGVDRDQTSPHETPFHKHSVWQRTKNICDFSVRVQIKYLDLKISSNAVSSLTKSRPQHHLIGHTSQLPANNMEKCGSTK